MRLRYDIFKKVSSHQENQYLNLIHRIIKTGVKTEGRNGTTISLLGEKMNFDLSNDKIPLLTTKKLVGKTSFKRIILVC